MIALALYHRTTGAGALKAVRNGFIDSKVRLGKRYVEGVLLSDMVIALHGTNALITAHFRNGAETAFARYELVNPKRTHRLWLVPAGVCNSFLEWSTVEVDGAAFVDARNAYLPAAAPIPAVPTGRSRDGFCDMDFEIFGGVRSWAQR